MIPAAFGEAALAYAERGWPVIALAPRSKQPLIATRDGGRGVHDATTDPTLITRWWARCPDANIGLAAGAAFWCLDCDFKGWEPPQPDGADSLAVLVEQFGKLPPTVQQLTGGGGWQFLFAPDVRIGNGVGTLPGLDTRASGGYVVASPSIHPNGRTYHWRRDRGPGEIALAPAPDWLLALVAPPPEPGPAPRPGRITAGDSYARAALEGVTGEVATAAKGARNHTLFKAAARAADLIRDGKLEEATARAALTEAGLTCGLPAFEINQTITSGLRRGLASTGELRP
jgi:hypothetical protein